MNIDLIDFHCHLDLYPDHLELINNCEKNHIRTLAVTTTPKAWTRNRDLTKNTKYVRAALGLHPQLVGPYATKDLLLWDQYFHETKYIGEVGLDSGPNFFHTIKEQQRVFQHILKKCAEAGNKILTVHSVRSTTTVLNYIEDYLPISSRFLVLHWFTGTISEAKRALELGCYFSINTAMLQTKKGQQLISFIPVERMLTETDGPFIEWQNKPSTPINVKNTIELIANEINQPTEWVSKTIMHNLKALLEKSTNK